MLRALAKEPQNRFASADEFLRALDLAEADPSGAALGDTAAFSPLGAAAAGGLAGAAAGAALGAGAAEAATPPASSRSRRVANRRHPRRRRRRAG